MQLPSESTRLTISAVAYKEGDLYIVQGIEYDIVAHAGRLKDVRAAFAKAVMENIAVTIHLGREPLAGIAPAPTYFKDWFDAAEASVRAL